jgi:hypothetical protein
MGPQSPTNETLGRLLTDLYSQPGVCGACLQVRDTVLIHDLPYSDDRIDGLAKRIDRLIAGYENVGRSIWQICAGFEKYRLLILCRSNTRLSILLKPETDPALIAGRATRLLMEVEIPDGSAAQPPPEKSTDTPIAAAGIPAAVIPAALGTDPDGMPREELERLVVGLLSRVTGSVTASKLIQREFAGKNGTAAFPKEEARKLGLAVLENIPNRGKREALVSEFLNALKS